MGVNAIYLKKGATVPAPASDEVVIVAESDGTLKKMGSDAARATVGGGSDPWRDTAHSFVTSVVSTLVPMERSTCASKTFDVETAVVAGSGAANQLTTKNGGVIQLTSTGTANSGIKMRRKNSSAEPNTANARTQKWAIATRARIIAITATGQIDLCNMTDEATADCIFGIIGSVSTVNFTIQIAGANTPVAVAFDTTAPHTYYWIADGTNIRAYVDGVLIATVAQSTAANGAAYWRNLVQNGATASNAELQVDDLAVWTEPAT